MRITANGGSPVAELWRLLIWLPDPTTFKPIENAQLLQPSESGRVAGLRVEAAYFDNKANGPASSSMRG